MLVVTIHDVAPPTLPAVAALRGQAAEWGAARVTLLAVPNFHGRAPLAEHAPTVDWLRRCSDAGDEVALHGIRHLQSAQTDLRGALRARLFSAGEAEMLGAGAADPDALVRARDELAALVRAPIRGFVAPAWLEPRGFGDVLERLGFEWHETGFAIERLRDRQRIVSPVIGFATRTWARRIASLAWAAALVPAIERAAASRPARIALHPSDLSSASVVAAAARAVRRLAAAYPSTTTAAALGLAPTSGSSIARPDRQPLEHSRGGDD
jgi:predicted deacetylase